jgi:hypothetical protein
MWSKPHNGYAACSEIPVSQVGTAVVGFCRLRKETGKMKKDSVARMDESQAQKKVLFARIALAAEDLYPSSALDGPEFDEYVRNARGVLFGWANRLSRTDVVVLGNLMELMVEFPPGQATFEAIKAMGA